VTSARASQATSPAAEPRATLERAMDAHRAHDLDRAERLYREVLQRDPAHPDALHYLGVLCHQRDRSEEAVELVGRALEITPRHPDAHNNLGNIHKECGRLAEAEACYRRALACDARHVNALANLAIVLEAQQRPQEAFVAYMALLKHAPEYAHGYYLLGIFLRENAQGPEHIEQSAECLRTAHALDPGNTRALSALGVSLYLLGRREESAQVYRDWLAREPDHPVPRHMLAASGGAPVPARADDSYVRGLFDHFADSFDEQLLRNLDYRAPRVLAGALAGVLGAPAATLDVLDAGCGTGLCGPLLRPWARGLTGVDLSPRMIAKARQRGDYDALETTELTAFLQSHPSAWDLVVSADTLIYFGELGPVLAAAAKALRPSGWLAFSLESMPDGEDKVELTPSGRYRHSQAHVRSRLESAGFGEIAISADSLRKEFGEGVASWVVLARNAQSRDPGDQPESGKLT
jgi:predicted TPR repeat methyltransferase